MPPCDFNDAIHDLAQPCRNGLKRSPGCHAVTRRPDGAVFFQVQFMELAEGNGLDVIDGVQFCRNEMKRIKTAFPPDIIFTRVPDRPVIGQKISFSPSGDVYKRQR